MRLSFTFSCRINSNDREEGRLLAAANALFLSTDVHDGRHGTPQCFHTLWPVLCVVAPLLRSGVRHLTPQDVSDLLFSVSREYVARQAPFDV